jgi:hypothetical protein
MRPTLPRGTVAIENLASLELRGKREEDGFRVTITQNQRQLFSVLLPLDDFFLTDGLTPTLPLAGFKVGDTFQVAAFDPIVMAATNVDVMVTEQNPREIDGVFMDVFTLESLFHGTTSTSLVTADGTLLTQRFGRPFENVVLRRESRKRDRHGF